MAGLLCSLNDSAGFYASEQENVKEMLTVDQALNKLMTSVTAFEVTPMPLTQAMGLTLAEDVLSSIDLPPFDKALMDGYAVRSEDIASGTASLRVIEVVTAGKVPQQVVNAGEATQIMTGAPLPQGIDTVIKIEDTQRDGDLVSITTKPQTVGTHFIRRGTSIRAGGRVLPAGLTLTAPRIGALAEVGQASVPIRRRPRVAVLATGDELVPFEQTPGPGQIRNSNELMLVAQLAKAGAEPVPLGIARDNLEDLRAKIDQGLQCDMLVLSGGVSAGTLDLVPSTLATAGVREVFHKVEMKPGKPIWFGATDAPAQASGGRERPRCYVFGLPGNPVSSLVCCELFVCTAIRRLMGAEPAIPQSETAQLEHAYSTRHDRPTYHPARISHTPRGLTVTLVPWHGSSDLCGTVAANGMAYLPSEARQHQIGDRLDTFAW